MLISALLVFALVGTVSSTVYCVMALRAAAYFKGSTRLGDPRSSVDEPISVLKPVHGEGEDLEANLITLYEQDHGSFEVLFGARGFDDPALKTVANLAKRYSAIRTQIVAVGEPEWPNARAHSVNSLVAQAHNSTLVTTDSDVRVEKDFLRKIVRPLADPAVGLVTCLYRGVSAGGVWSGLEALGMSVELMSNVLIANMLNGMDFALGPATATKRSHLERIGGLQEIGSYYADDFALGNRMSQSGLKVVLAETVVEHVVPVSSFMESIRHQILWMKNNRYLRPRGHVGVGLTFAMPYALLGGILSAAIHHPNAAVAWVAYGILLCIIRCVAVGWGVIGDRVALSFSWLYPIRDLLGFFIWLSTWSGNTIVFRGEKYTLLHDGRVERVSS